MIWHDMEFLLHSTFASAGYLEVSLVFIFFFWLFSERVIAAMEVMSTKLYEQYEAGIPLKHHLTQYQLRKREELMKSRNATRESFESALYSLKETPWCGSGSIRQRSRPSVRLSCTDCCPQSRKSIPVSQDLPLIDILKLNTYTKAEPQGIFRLFPLIKHCLTFKKHHFPYIYDSVLSDENLIEAVNQSGYDEALEHGVTDPEGIQRFIESQRKRAVYILKAMRSKLSDTLIRVTSWVLFKTLPFLFRGICIPRGQVEMLRRAAASEVPLVFLPLHRSHIDYIAVTLILSNNGIKSPLVAAGENLNIPFFGWAMRHLGAFFIKRRMDPLTGKKDKVYRAVLHNYMLHCLQAGHYFEFFIEGGRSRTGKPYMPKGGLMSVFVDAYQSGMLEDALLVPVSINYDKIVEGNFTSELTGEPKIPETFSSALKAIWESFTSQYGLMRVDFNQPFSLHELVKSFHNKVQLSNGVGSRFHSPPSTASLYGTDVVNEENRLLVDSITRHVLYDCSQSMAVMSTNALSFLLLYCYRSGATLTQLTFALDKLRTELEIEKKDTGFSGESKDVIENAAKLLGRGLVQVEGSGPEAVYRPVTCLPNVLELMYYSNTVTTHFSIEGVVGRSLLSLTADSEKAMISLDRIVEVSTLLCEILQFEFIFTKSCQMLKDVIFDCVEKMTTTDLISKVEIKSSVSARGFSATLEMLNVDEEEDDFAPPSPLYQINRECERLELYGRMLEPLIDVYCLATGELSRVLAGEVLPERVLLKSLLQLIKQSIEEGTIRNAESLNVETVKNWLKLMEKWKVVDCHLEAGTKLYYLSRTYDTEPTMLSQIMRKVQQFSTPNLPTQLP